MFQIKSNAPEFEDCSDLDNCMCEFHEKDREPKIVNYLFPLNLDGVLQHRQLGCFDKKITFWGVVMVLSNAKMDVDGKMVWVEEDYCSPSLAMERGCFG